jgi:hypothetical protein
MLRRKAKAAPDDPVGWLAGHGWAAELAGAREVLQAHGRPVPAARDDGRAPRPRALLISATARALAAPAPGPGTAHAARR